MKMNSAMKKGFYKTKLKKIKTVTTVATTLGLSKKFYSIDDVHTLEAEPVDGAGNKVKVKESGKRYLITTRTVYKHDVRDFGYSAASYMKKIKDCKQNNFDLNRLLSQMTALYQHCNMVKGVK